MPTVTPAATLGGLSSPDGAAVAAVPSVCARCGGVGWLRRDVPIGHQAFGRAVACPCQLEALKQKRLDRLYEMSRLGDHLRGMSFENFLTQDIPYDPEVVANAQFRGEIFKGLQRAASIARHFAAEPRAWLLLIGHYGCGKTHLAVAIANARIALGEPALFQVVPDLLDHLRATFAPNSTVTYDDLFEEVRSAPLLILDDLGAHSSSPWAEEKLFQLVNYRYNSQLPTVVTTNMPLDRLEPRLVSRMTDMGSTLLNVNAPDFRGGLAPSRATAGKMPASMRGRASGR